MKNNFLLLLASTAFLLVVFVVFGLAGKRVDAGPTAEGYNSDLSGQIYKDDKFAYVDGKDIELPTSVFENTSSHPVLGAVSDQKWIEVDLSDQKLYAWEGNTKYLETLVSTGLPGTPTPQGEFKVWIKLRSTKMEGGSGKGYYYLPNVPYTMFFENAQVPGWKGYGLHGTYWHSDFGHTHSHGCVNLPTPIAKQLYDWTTPVVPDGKGMIRADDANPGTRIVIHE